MDGTIDKKDYNDLSFEEGCEKCEALAKEGAIFFQKFTCSHCQARQEMSDINTIYTAGKCEECGAITDIEQAGFGFAVFMTSNPDAFKEVVDKFNKEYAEYAARGQTTKDMVADLQKKDKE